MNTTKLLSAAFLGALFPLAVAAECLPTQDCKALGYTDAACPEQGVKCPFGNEWFCVGDKNKSNLECQIGWIYYTDNTCSNDVISGKKPLGIVVYTYGAAGGGQIIAANKTNKGIAWSTEQTNVPGLTTSSTAQHIINDRESCLNTKIITSYGDQSKYPAAWAAKEYAPGDAPETKGKWCLPAAGVLHSIANNLTTINNAVNKIGGDAIGGDNLSQERFWSSTGHLSSRYGWAFIKPSGYDVTGLGGLDRSGTYSAYVRPVFEY